jgi:phage/plasmid-like protein (TIGR03299 family)
MSKETLEWLNQNTLIGFTAKRGTAWHYHRGLQGSESNHYTGPIPVQDVHRRLFAWEAVPSQVYVTNPLTGHLEQDEEKVAFSRSDTGRVLGYFGPGYEPHPYAEWLLQKVAMMLDGELAIGSAGLLRGGAVAWVSVEVPENVVTPEGVAFRPHLLAATSFDGSLATTYKRAITNVVCDNTMSAALGEAGQAIKVKHSRRSALKLLEARDALNLVYQVADAFTEEVARLCRVTVTDRQWQKFLDAHAALPEQPGRGRTLAENKRETLSRLWTGDERVAPWHGTAYGVLQAVNTYAHHEQTVRGTTRPERNALRAVTGDIDDLDRATVSTLTTVLDRADLVRAA